MLLLIDTLLGQGKLREKKRQSLLIQNQKQCELKLESVCLLGLCNSYNFSSLLSLFPTSDLSLHLLHLHIFSAPWLADTNTRTTQRSQVMQQESCA